MGCGILFVDLKQFYRLDETFGDGDTGSVLARIEQSLEHQQCGDDVFAIGTTKKI
jgi:hypothetical protein